MNIHNEEDDSDDQAMDKENGGQFGPGGPNALARRLL